jgi:hypothetical protein
MADKDFNNNYIKVKQRILQLKKDGLWNDVSVQTEVVKIDTQLDVTGKQKLFAIVKANVQIGTQFFTAHAMETQGIGEVNYLHFLENAETSAVGRALSFAGIAEEGVAEEDSNVATKEDIETAKEQVKDINAEKRKEVAKKLIEEGLNKKQLKLDVTPEPKKEVAQLVIPVFKEVTGTIREKKDREEVIAWLRKVGKFDENLLIGAMIKAEISSKFKSFNELLHKGTYNDLVTVFNYL